MVDRIGGKGKGPYRVNGGGPDVVTLVRRRDQTDRSKLTRNGCRCPARLLDAWRRTKRYCCSGLVFARTAWRPSSFARTATVGTAIAAMYAVDGRDASSGSAPINVISAARKGGSIIATASVSTGRGSAENAHA